VTQTIKKNNHYVSVGFKDFRPKSCSSQILKIKSSTALLCADVLIPFYLQFEGVFFFPMH